MFFWVYSRGSHTVAGPHGQLASAIIYHTEKYWSQMAPRRNFFWKKTVPLLESSWKWCFFVKKHQNSTWKGSILWWWKWLDWVLFQWSENDQWLQNMPDMSGRLLLMSGRELIPCWTFCPAGFNQHNVWQSRDKEKENDHWYLPVVNWEKCLTGTLNVRQHVEGLLDILSGTPEIIFTITVNDQPEREQRKLYISSISYILMDGLSHTD